MGLNSPGSSASALRRRFFVLSLVATGFFLLLLGRLWYLQVIQSAEYISLSDRNRTRLIPIEPPRGSIEEVGFHQRALPEAPVIEEPDDLIAILFAMSFNGPPE